VQVASLVSRPIEAPVIEAPLPPVAPPKRLENTEITCEVWHTMVIATLQRVREKAKQNGEPSEITRKKLDAIRVHEKENGSVAVCNLGSGEELILYGIRIRN
jgi:hypothetical protein